MVTFNECGTRVQKGRPGDAAAKVVIPQLERYDKDKNQTICLVDERKGGGEFVDVALARVPSGRSGSRPWGTLVMPWPISNVLHRVQPNRGNGLQSITWSVSLVSSRAFGNLSPLGEHDGGRVRKWFGRGIASERASDQTGPGTHLIRTSGNNSGHAWPSGPWSLTSPQPSRRPLKE